MNFFQRIKVFSLGYHPHQHRTAVIVEKELARQVFVSYSSQRSYLAGMIENSYIINLLLKKGTWGTFKY